MGHNAQCKSVNHPYALSAIRKHKGCSPALHCRTLRVLGVGCVLDACVDVQEGLCLLSHIQHTHLQAHLHTCTLARLHTCIAFSLHALG